MHAWGASPAAGRRRGRPAGCTSHKHGGWGEVIRAPARLRAPTLLVSRKLRDALGPLQQPAAASPWHRTPFGGPCVLGHQEDGLHGAGCELAQPRICAGPGLARCSSPTRAKDAAAGRTARVGVVSARRQLGQPVASP
eukprot:scaffold50_cov420-Prasinococcus_capsulatus_cf.AAC.47